MKSIITSCIRTKACMTAKGDAPMLTARHPVDFSYTRAGIEALFRYAREHDVENGGRYDARAACILFWSHHWLHPATREESEIIGSLYVRWGGTPTLWEIETEEGFSLDDFMAAAGQNLVCLLVHQPARSCAVLDLRLLAESGRFVCHAGERHRFFR